MSDIGSAIAHLDQMVDMLQGDIKTGGFNNDSVLTLIKAWTKVTILAGLSNDLKGYWIMKRPPAQIVGKRSLALLRALEAYQNILESSVNNPILRSGDFYYRARDAMLNFVYEYRQNISGQTERDFVLQIQTFMGLTADQVLQLVVTPMDQGD